MAARECKSLLDTAMPDNAETPLAQISRRGIRITLADGDEDSIHVDVDGRVRFRLTEDQARRLQEAIRRVLAQPRSLKQRCRAQWKKIATNGGKLVLHSKNDDGSTIHYTLIDIYHDDFGDMYVRFGRPMLSIAAEDFVLCLQTADREEAMQWFKRHGRLGEVFDGA
jgi:hypothetical protein